jgi:hypothetical protein
MMTWISLNRADGNGATICFPNEGISFEVVLLTVVVILNDEAECASSLDASAELPLRRHSKA